ncbi:phage baseplate assembly protein [Desulfarculus baarsii]
MPDAEVTLTVGGRVLAGWESIRIEQGMDRLSGAFSLSIAEKYPGEPGKYNVAHGDPCVVALAGRTMITGYLDEPIITFGAEEHRIELQGMDKTADLVDCCHVAETTQWTGQTLAQIAAEVCRPFGITIHAEAAVGDPFDSAAIGQGETVHVFLAKLARQRALFLLSYGDGRLIITNSSGRPNGGTVEVGGNCKQITIGGAGVARFSQYIVKGQGRAAPPAQNLTPEQKEEYRKTYLAPAGRAADGVVKRWRPKVILAGQDATLADLEKRAAFEAARAAGMARPIRAACVGWGPAKGSYWRINSLVTVIDNRLGLRLQRLVERVSFSLDEQGGSISELSLVHPAAYLPEPASADDMKGVFDG